MFEDIYPFKAANFYKLFTFNSASPEKVVVKVVQFNRIEENLYNLGLADFERGKLQFTETSNNQDIVRVIGFTSGKWEDYVPGNSYEAIKIKRKP